MQKDDRFTGELGFLSNFHNSPMTICSERWPTVEHYFQAMKTMDPIERAMIQKAKTPGCAKRFGRGATLRTDWEQIKDTVMCQGVKNKFFQNKHLAKKLLATGEDDLVEVNFWHDNVWGDCRCKNCASIPGQNRLGKILMDVRTALKGGY